MADKLSVTVTFVKDHYEVTAEMIELDVMPAEIFLYENLGTPTIGAYQGVAFKDDLTSRQVFTGVAIDTFGNKYVRTGEMFKSVATEAEAESVARHLINSVERLKEEILAAEPQTEVVTIEGN